MAGLGSRFTEGGYKKPKPLLEIDRFLMIELVYRNLMPAIPHRFIFICQKRHLEDYKLAKILKQFPSEVEIVEIDGLTEGPLCSVMKARHLIDNDASLMIANCDQFIDVNIDDYLDAFIKSKSDGYIMTMRADDCKWSFVKLDKNGFVKEVQEKVAISNEATVGIYNFRKGDFFVATADEMIKCNLRTNNEFYVAPLYNLLIERGKTVGVYNIGEENNGMYGLGIPKDYENFKASPVMKKVKKLSKW